MRKVELTQAPVELFKILKFEGIAESGGEAKSMIENGHVLLNGKIETRKRKKIVSGDLIEVNQESLKISCRNPDK
ncbi:RNA-binding S4 domain-containing protein [Kiritimatiellaeota bacterium B1221]|nr:RNA-binding S4 domain-containing protein [Kiritimatiellaeota bacterium B1221]